VVSGVKRLNELNFEIFFSSFGIEMLDLAFCSDDNEERGGSPNA
jgi:hypothetical protein